MSLWVSKWQERQWKRDFLRLARLVFPQRLHRCEVYLASTKAVSIPLERMNTKGDYDQSGLAKKLATALEQDAILSAFKSNQGIYSNTGLG